MQITAKLDLGIYESLPFEKVDFKANLLNGKLEIERLSINSVANAQMAFGGAISGFGNVPAYENLKYEVKTDDVSGLINKFEFKAPNLDYKQLKHFESKGIATGDLENLPSKMSDGWKVWNLFTAVRLSNNRTDFNITEIWS